MTKDKGVICARHGKELVTQSAKKILRVIRKCGHCWENFRQQNNNMCEQHTKNFEEWEAVQVNNYRESCEDCREVAK